MYAWRAGGAESRRGHEPPVPGIRAQGFGTPTVSLSPTIRWISCFAYSKLGRVVDVEEFPNSLNLSASGSELRVQTKPIQATAISPSAWCLAYVCQLHPSKMFRQARFGWFPTPADAAPSAAKTSSKLSACLKRIPNCGPSCPTLSSKNQPDFRAPLVIQSREPAVPEGVAASVLRC